MDLSVRVDPGASWQADFTRNGCRRRQVPSFCNLASNRLAFTKDLSMMPTRVEFHTAARSCVRMKRRTRATVDNSCTAVQHLTKALFLSKPVEPLLTHLQYRIVFTWISSIVLEVFWRQERDFSCESAHGRAYRSPLTSTRLSTSANIP